MKHLEGKWVIRTKPNEKGDRSYTTLPIRLIKVTDTHYYYTRDDYSSKYNRPHVALIEDDDRDSWVEVDECFFEGVR